MAANEVMELLWLKGSITPNHAALLPPTAAAAEAARQGHLFMQDDEMASWLHYPIQDTNLESDITKYFNPPPPPQELNLRTPTELKIQLQNQSVSLTPFSAARPPVPQPSPRRLVNFVHFTDGEAARKESRASSSGKAATVVKSNETPKASQVGSSEVPKVECGRMSLNDGGGGGGGTTTSARDSMTTINSDDFTSSPGDSGASMTACGEPAQPTSAVGMIREEDSEAVKGDDQKRKGRGGDDNEGQNLDIEFEFESGKEKKQERASTSTKRFRAAEVHNLSERKRRDRINEKMKALLQIVPCCNKTDKVSILDDAIEYMKTLQSQVQMMSMGYGMVPVTYPGMLQYMPAMGMGMGMSVNHPLVPYPPMLQGSTMPIPAAGVPMHMPVVHDQSRLQASNPVDPAMTSMAPHNPHPNFTNPYLQYPDPQHCQVFIPQNQASKEQNNTNISTNREDGKC